MAASKLATTSDSAATRLPLLLLTGWLALVIAGCALAAVAHSTKVLPADLAVAQEIQERRPADIVLAPLLRVVSIPGYSPWDVMLYVAAVTVLLLLRRWAAAALVALTVTGDAMAYTVKLVVARPRP